MKKNVMAKKKSETKKIMTSFKKYKGKALSWLVGAIMGLVLTKACNMIWPDPPVVVKEQTDTVRVIHAMSPFPADSDSILKKQIEQQLMNIELLNKYEKQIKRRIDDNAVEACKIILGNPYPNSSGFSMKDASSFSLIELKHNGPVIDIIYSFIRQDYVALVNTLGVKISHRNEKDGKDWVDYDQNFEPQTDRKDMLVRIIDNLPPGEYEVEAGFVLKEDMKKKYPSFNRQKFVFKK